MDSWPFLNAWLKHWTGWMHRVPVFGTRILGFPLLPPRFLSAKRLIGYWVTATFAAGGLA